MKKQYLLYVMAFLVWGTLFFACNEEKDTTDDLVSSVVFDAAAVKVFSFSEGSAVEIPIPEPTITNGSGTITYSITAGDDAEDPMFVIGGEESNIIVLAEGKLLDHESASSYTLTITATVGSVTATIDITITVTDVDTVVFSSGKASVIVSENTWTNIPIPSASVEDDTSHKTFTYSITAGDDAADPMFAIGGAAKNQIVLAKGKSLDYESGTISYLLTITATARADGSVKGDVEVEITVRNVNEAPVITAIADTSLSFVENTPTTDVLIDIDATDPDTGETRTLRYSLINPPRDLFTIDTRGVVRFTVSPDYETEAHRMNTLAITVTDSESGIATTNITITVTGINDEDPTITSHSDGDVLFARPGEVNVVTFLAMDEDVPPPELTFMLGGTDNDTFTLNTSGSNGALAFTNDGDAARGSTYQITAMVRDATSSSPTYTFTINIPDLAFDDATAITDFGSIAENETTLNIAIPEAATTHGGDQTTVRYSITVGNDAIPPIFAIGGTDNNKVVFATGKLNFDTAEMHTLTITATLDIVAADMSPYSLTDTIDLTFDVIDVDLFFDSSATTTFTFAEDSHSTGSINSDRTILDIPAASFYDDTTADTRITYTIDNDIFGINASTKKLYLKADKALDYEVNPDHSYDLTITASITHNSTDYTAMQSLTINVTDIDEPIRIASMSHTSGATGTAVVSNHVGFGHEINYDSNTIKVSIPQSSQSNSTFTLGLKDDSSDVDFNTYAITVGKSGNNSNFDSSRSSIGGAPIEIKILNTGHIQVRNSGNYNNVGENWTSHIKLRKPKVGGVFQPIMRTYTIIVTVVD